MKKQDPHDRRRGSAIFTVFVVIFAVCAVLGTVVSAGLNRAFMARRLADQVCAKAIAEAGVAETFASLSTNWGFRTNSTAFPLTTYAGGTYDVTVNSIDDFSAVICSTGTYNDVTEVAILDIRLFVETVGPSGGGPYDCVIVAEGTIAWTGCGQFSEGGRVHANGKFVQSGCGELDTEIASSTEAELKGNSGHVDGDGYAPSISDPHNKIWGTKHVGPIAPLAIPELELAAYYNHALANGEVYSGPKRITTDTTPVGGIMWVNGDLQVTAQADLTGCFIATGDIRISSSGTHTKVAEYPAFVSRDGALIKITSQFDSHGLIYARIGNIEIAGGGTMTGSLMCGGNFKKSGNSCMFAYEESVPVAPGETTSEGRLCAMAWQR